MKQFMKDCEKLISVVKSCKTDEQIMSAYNYYKLWDKKYPLEATPKFAKGMNSYTAGYSLGFFSAWAKTRNI